MFISSTSSKAYWSQTMIYAADFIWEPGGTGFSCTLSCPPFHNGPEQVFSPPNRAVQKAPGISGQSNVQSSMGQNSKERNTRGFRITEVISLTK